MREFITKWATGLVALAGVTCVIYVALWLWIAFIKWAVAHA